MIVSVALGTALATSLVTLSLDISTKVAKELRAFGANIVVEPLVTKLQDLTGQKRYLFEDDLIKIKTIFWRHNILGILPILYVEDPSSGFKVMGTWYEKALKVPGQKEPFLTGIKTVMGGWLLKGRWPSSQDEIVAGASTGLQIGNEVTLFGKKMKIVGILRTGSQEDEMLVGELHTVQEISSLKGRVSKVLVSALTTPMDEFAYQDPEKMSRREYEKWYCTAYVTSIAKQIEEVVRGSRARPVWPVAETEGKLLNKLKLLIYLLTGASLLSASLGVSTTMVMSLLRRTDEVALMKAIGADRPKTIQVFLSEALMIGLIGGIAGYLLSLPLSSYMGLKVFGVSLKQRGLLLPLSILSSVLIATIGAYIPVRKALRIEPAVVLKGL
ncbi:MAG: ABC transporter permease [Nitrospirae bacterium]|nr:MAG: ABC transporter permease [Nitrospirota bacterium]